jgi:hypothetical protein
MATPAGLVTDFQFAYEVAGMDFSYAITYADFSPEQVRHVPFDQVIDAGRQGFLQKYNGVLEADKRIVLDRYPGREIIIIIPGKGKFLIRYYVVDLRLFTISISGTTASTDSKEVQTFFKSLRFTNKNP